MFSCYNELILVIPLTYMLRTELLLFSKIFFFSMFSYCLLNSHESIPDVTEQQSESRMVFSRQS